MQPYYNTTNLSGKDLEIAVAAAKNQDDAILTIFLNTRSEWSPWQIHRALLKAGRNSPVTSARRSITNLTTSGHLIMTGEQVIGEYGRPENVWKINCVKYPQGLLKQSTLFQ